METMVMNATGTATVEPAKKRKASIARKLMTAGMCANAMLATTAITATTAFADEWDSINVGGVSTGSPTTLMNKVIGILLTITRYAGIALVVYGIYEIVMSFMQNQPDAKTKGIIMAIAGVVMISMKSVVQEVLDIGGGAG